MLYITFWHRALKYLQESNVTMHDVLEWGNIHYSTDVGIYIKFHGEMRFFDFPSNRSSD